MKIQSIVEHQQGFKSKIVGEDIYILKQADNKRIKWESYTLVSQEPSPFDRWYLVDFGTFEQLGLYYFVKANSMPPESELFEPLCREVEVVSEGDNIVSTNTSKLLTYREGNMLYGVEEFEGGEKYIMIGRPGKMDGNIFTPGL